MGTTRVGGTRDRRDAGAGGGGPSGARAASVAPAHRVRPRARRRVVPAMGFLVLALGACAPDEAPAARRAPAYDADSAARGLLAPELAALLAVDTLLDGAWLARHGGRCRVEPLRDLGHLRRVIHAPLPSGLVTVSTRTTPQGEVRRIELLHRAGRRARAGLTWDASKQETVLTEWPAGGDGPIRRTTMRDPEAPIVAGMRYVGRRANLVAPCDTASAKRN